MLCEKNTKYYVGKQIKLTLQYIKGVTNKQLNLISCGIAYGRLVCFMINQSNNVTSEA
jgi:hypothetical protein